MKLLLMSLILWQVQEPAPFQEARAAVPFNSSENLGAFLVRLGLHFAGTPYVPGTLEGNQQEALVVNFEGMDCFTFMENTLALAHSLHGDGSYAAFEQALTRIRYRQGVLDGYASRLHYTTDWAWDNGQLGLIVDITASIGGKPYQRTINFMSEHHDKYPGLADAQALARIKQAEAAINERTYHYLPEEELHTAEAKIQEGDILALTTSIKGLDVVHVGFAVFRNQRLHLLHASSVNKQVEITDKPLQDILLASPSRNGIMVFRPQRPPQTSPETPR